MKVTPSISLFPIPGIPLIAPRDDLAFVINKCAQEIGLELKDGVLVVAQKVISKAEDRLVSMSEVTPSEKAREIAREDEKDPRHMEVVLQESEAIVRHGNRVLITETRHGFVCANAGVDLSNAPGEDIAVLLPLNPDESAKQLRKGLEELGGERLAVVITDTFGRPWREGTTNIAIGIAGINPLIDYRGIYDIHGREMHVSISAIADEIAGATEIVMAKTAKIPAALLRGLEYDSTSHSISEMIRSPENDLFR